MATARVNSRVWRFRDAMASIRGALICSLIVIILDVVIDGSYLFSSLVCPIWFLAAVVRAVMRRPTMGVASARVLFPLVTGLLSVVNYSAQSTIAMANAARLIQACVHYREANGAYPERLGDLAPRYLSSIPRAKYCCSKSEFGYYASPRHMLFWWACPPFGRMVYAFETGEWRYVD